MLDHSTLKTPETARAEALKLIEVIEVMLAPSEKKTDDDPDKQTKDELEEELKTLHTNLQTMNAELGQSLIDAEGFPRGDIDVYSVRLSRV